MVLLRAADKFSEALLSTNLYNSCEEYMLELKETINILGIIVAVIAVLLLGDYVGHKIGRWRLAIIGGVVVLVSIIAFAIYAAVAAYVLA